MKVYKGVTNEVKKALEHDNYVKETKYSTTDLISSVQAVVLKNRYKNEIENLIDPIERIWRVFGSAGHYFLEKGKIKGDLVEKRFCHEKLDFSGKIDHWCCKNKVLTDYKFTKTWALIFEDGLIDYEKQLVINAFLMEQKEIEINKIQLQLFLKDWSKLSYERGKYDISSDVMIVDYGKPDFNDMPVDNYIYYKYNEFEKYEKVIDTDLPKCSEEYRWAEKDVYKIYWNESKALNPKSKKNSDTLEEAESYKNYLEQKDDKKTYRIELIVGNKYKKCEYCDARYVCLQYQESKDINL